MIETTLQQRAAELRDQGRRTAYAIDYATVSDPSAATHLHICLGEQWSGKRLYMVDLDSHTKGQDAGAALAAFRAARPELAAKLDFYPSKHGGFHALFESSVQIPTGKLYDQANNHIGELLGADSDRTLDPGNVQIPCLHAGEIERLLNVWHVKGSDPKGERWADRAKQGEQWTRGYQYIPVTRQQLRTFLQNDAGKVGRQLDSYFDQPPRNRSDAAGSLMQNIMFFARRLPGCANAPFHTRCANVMAYWTAAKSFGKADDKDYSQEKDGWSLIAQIVNQDPYGEGKRWACPSWVDGTTATAAPAPQPAPEAPRPAHRPAGDRAKHLVTFRRVLEAIEPDDFGRRPYTLAYLEERMKIAHCPARPRTIQSYLKRLRGDGDGEIVTAQIGGNGMPYAILTRHFGGADNYQKRVETDAKPDNFGGADQIAEQGILLLQSAESPLQCKVDHQNTRVPTHQLPIAPTAVEDLVARDLAILREAYRDLRPLTPEERAKKRKPQQKRFIPRKGQQLDTRYSLASHGEGAAPTACRPRPAPLPLETLPDPPASAVPAGTRGAGAPLLAPAGAPEAT